MNEAETIAELIDPKVKEAGWGNVEGSVVRREFKITNGEIKPGNISNTAATAIDAPDIIS
mgnify:CR=1 FL=1